MGSASDPGIRVGYVKQVTARTASIGADAMKMRAGDRLTAATAGKTAIIRARCAPAITAATRKRKVVPIRSVLGAASAAMEENMGDRISAGNMAAAHTSAATTVRAAMA